MDTKFINLNKNIVSYLEDKKFSTFLPIQEQVIPLLLRNKSVFVESPTGTGKTLSFLIPIFQNINKENKNTQALIIVPTKELATQIFNVANDMNMHQDKKISLTLAIGGKDYNDQLRKINNGSQIVIGTLERLISLKRNKKDFLNNLNYLVIDEIDMFINFGFIDDLFKLFNELNENIVISFFSATFSIEIQNKIKKIFKQKINNIISKEKEDSELTSYLLKAFNNDKLKALLDLLNSNYFNPYFCIIFAKTNTEVLDVFNFLKNNNIKDIEYFNNELSQRERTRVLKLIKNNKIVYLVTTDVMSRGMDFEGVTHIINYSLPADLSYYKHRIGRTNRNNIKGNIYDIYIDEDLNKYDLISKKNKNVNFVKWKAK